MEKYKSDLILEDEIKVEVDDYYEDDIKHNIVKVTHIPTGTEATVSSQISQISAYNKAIKRLEDKIR